MMLTQIVEVESGILEFIRDANGKLAKVRYTSRDIDWADFNVDTAEWCAYCGAILTMDDGGELISTDRRDMFCFGSPSNMHVVDTSMWE